MKRVYFFSKHKYNNSIFKNIIPFCFLLIGLLFSSTVFGQGTTCGTATSITINGSCLSGTINDITLNNPAISGCSAGTARREGWYAFTVAGGPLNVTITASASDRNLYLQLISQAGACSGLTQIACANSDNTNNSAQTETISNQTLSNGTYYIKVVNHGNNNNMALTNLCVRAAPTITSFTPNVACFNSGTSVVITGTYFTGVTDVKFNGTSAISYTVDSSTQITATIPNGATTGTITVTNAGGTGTSSGNFTVYPIFNSGTINNTGEAICENDDPPAIGSISNASGGDNTITYKWQANGVDIPGSDIALFDPPTGLTTTTTFTRLAKDGTCNGYTASAGSWTVTVNTLSVPPTGIIGTTTICNGGSTTLTISGGFAGTGAAAEWFDDACDGNLIGTGNSIVVSPATSTTYYVRYNGTCNTTSCASVTVTINTPSTDPSTISGTTTICEGDSTTLTVTDGTLGDGATIEWFSGSCGGTPAGTGDSITVSPTSTTDYFVRYTNSCNMTNCATITVTVNSISVAPTNITGTTTVCSGDSTTLALNGGFAGLGATAEWFDNSCGGNLIGTGNSILVTPAVTTTYYVRYSGTCNSTSCASATVNVNTQSTDPSTISGTTTICEGDSTTLTVTDGTLGDGATIEWYSDTCGGTPAGTGNSITVSPVSTTDYFVRYTNLCNITNCATITVTVNSISVAPTNITGTTTICSGDSTTLNLNGGFAGLGATAEWFDDSCGGDLIGTGNSISVSPAITTTYYVRYNGTCNITTCASVVVNVNTASTAPTNITGTTTICSGNSTTLTVAGGTPGDGAIAEWFSGSCGGTFEGTGNSILVSPITTTNYFVRYSNLCGSTSCAAVTVTVDTPSTAPTGISGTTTICNGGSTTLTVSGGSIGGGAITNWFTSSCNGTLIGTGNSIIVSPTSNTDYYVNYSNTCNTTSCASVTVTVNSLPFITSQPAVTQSICSGSAASFTVGASGTGITYQWYKGATILTNGGAISGADSAILTINPITAIDAATDYHCVVSGSCIPNATSNNAALIVLETPIIPMQNLTICNNDSFYLPIINGFPTLATVVPTGTTYSWPAPIVTGGITGGTAQSGQTTINDTLYNPTNTVQTATYTVTPISGTTGNCVGAPFTVIVSVNPSAFINTISQNQCSATPFTITPTNGGGNIIPPGTTYSWGAPTVSGGMTGGTFGTNQANISQTLVNSTGTVQTATYNVTATTGICIGSTFSIFVDVYPKPIASGTPATQSLCSGNSISDITISETTAMPGIIDYSWSRDNTVNTSGIAASGTGSPITGSLTNTTTTPQTTVFSLYATSPDGCTSDPYPINVTVNPIPNVTASPANQTICSGNAISNITISNPNAVAGTTFSWTRDNDSNLTGIANSGTGTTISGSLTNTTNTSQTTTFTITASANGCSATINTITITVNPTPTVSVTLTSQTICGNSAISSINISNPNNVSGTTYSWTRDNTSNVTGIANNGTSASISGTLTNTTNSVQTVTFTINAVSGSCSSTATTATVTVNPTPALTISTASQTKCNAIAITLINLNDSRNVAGTTFSWTRDKTTELTGIAASGTGASISGTFTNTTAVTQTATFTITATAPNGCSNTSTATVTIYAPLTAPTISASQTICKDTDADPLVISTALTGGSGSYTYQWQKKDENDASFTNVSGATSPTFQPLAGNFGTNIRFVDYRLITTDICGTVTSNIITVEIVNEAGFIYTASGTPSGGLCPGTLPAFQLSGNHKKTSIVIFDWSVDSNYITPSSGTITETRVVSGNNVASSIAIGPLTVQNNSNSTQVIPITIKPNVYDYSDDPITGLELCEVATVTVPITIFPKPIATATVTNTTICNGTSAGITVNGNITDATMSYAWTRDNTGNVTGTISGNSGSIAAGSPFNFSNILTNTTEVSQNVTYTFTPSSNGCSGTPITVTITVVPTVTAGTIASNQTICSGDTPAVFTQTAGTGLNLTYQWQNSTDNITYSNIVGATGTTYAPGALTQTTWYNRVVTSTVNGTTCTATTASPIIITINNINPGSVSSDQTVCSGGDPTAFTSVAATGSGVVSYQWQSNTTGCGGTWTDIAGGTSATYDVASGIATTTYYRRIAISTLSGMPCTAYSNCVAVYVNNITAGTIGSDQTICGNNPNPFTQTVLASGTGTLSYQWQSSTDNISYNNISGANSATYDAPSGLTQTTYYRRIVTSTLNGLPCSAISNFVTITMNNVTAGSISISTNTICGGGDPVAFTNTASGTGTTLVYQWQSSTDGVIYTDILGATSATYDVPAGLTQTTYYRRTASSTVNSQLCSANTAPVTIFVNNVTASVISGSQTVCSGTDDPVAFTETSPAIWTGSSINYQWQSNATGCGGAWTNISGATSSTYDPPMPLQTTYYKAVITSGLNSINCSVSTNCITVTSLSKTWNGSQDPNWSNIYNWTPNGVPDATNCIIIPSTANNPIISGTNYNAFAKNITVNSGARVTVNSTNNITITDEVTVIPGGSFEFLNSANLVQINNSAVNTGNITYYRSANVRLHDYVYWSAPIANFPVTSISPATPTGVIWKWLPSYNGTDYGNWQNTTENMVIGKGYIVRGPSGYSATVPSNFTANFTGVPNNGSLTTAVSRGTRTTSYATPSGTATADDDNWNLIGNPYPSAINADEFLSANSILDGTIRLWTHGQSPSDTNPNPFYGSADYNYTVNDYITYNSGTGSNPPGFLGNIAAGQSFFTLLNHSAATPNTVTFNNGMRVDSGYNPYGNTQFYKNSNTSKLDRSRIWLNLVDENKTATSTLLGYCKNATLSKDRNFDSTFKIPNSLAIYSLIDADSMIIQGRPAPFNEDDIVPIGIVTPKNGNYSIAINQVDGIFDNAHQDIFLEDKELNILHDLRMMPYNFSSTAGTHSDRFAIRYTSASYLSVNNPEATTTFATTKSNTLKIEANEFIKEVSIFDISGKLLGKYSPKEYRKQFSESFNYPNGVYICTIKLDNDIVVNKKLIH